VVTSDERREVRGGLSYRHEDHADRVTVNRRDGEGDTLPALIDPKDYKLSCLCVVGDVRCPHPHLVNPISKLFSFFYPVQPVHSLKRW
jgi:hypothetical protein